MIRMTKDEDKNSYNEKMLYIKSYTHNSVSFFCEMTPSKWKNL